MKDKRPIEEQVAELTEKQKNTILKVDLFTGLAIVAVCLPACIRSIFSAIVIFNTTSFELADKLLISALIANLIAVILIIGIFIFVKVKFPYYTAKRCSYIRKSRKKK